jgi:hypothetical protein
MRLLEAQHSSTRTAHLFTHDCFLCRLLAGTPTAHRHVPSRQRLSCPGVHSQDSGLASSSILLSHLAIDVEAEGALASGLRGRVKSTTTMVPCVLSSLELYDRPALTMKTRQRLSSTPVTLLVCDEPPDGSGGLSMSCSRFEHGQRDAGGGHMRIGGWEYRVFSSTKGVCVSSTRPFPFFSAWK